MITGRLQTDYLRLLASAKHLFFEFREWRRQENGIIGRLLKYSRTGRTLPTRGHLYAMLALKIDWFRA